MEATQNGDNLFEDQNIVLVDTQNLLRAAKELKQSKEDFQSLLEQAELGDTSVQYDLGEHYASGDGVETDFE